MRLMIGFSSSHEVFVSLVNFPNPLHQPPRTDLQVTHHRLLTCSIKSVLSISSKSLQTRYRLMLINLSRNLASLGHWKQKQLTNHNPKPNKNIPNDQK